ncbi:MAG: UvrD-helicase domain-containing protein [Magnetococcales bacterium]|nr:UvrD-helicase domain-containing protein [Magnetococcales bacterium]
MTTPLINTTSAPEDASIRHEVLDPKRSFIVQAPAGSGKTALLTQRVLTLLATVQEPEEVLAITFTRKAAAEMRARIIDALTTARQETEPEAEHERHTWRLARAVLQRDKAQGWHLVAHPMRLRVLTIDGLCALLTRQAPISTRFGAQPEITQDATPLYRQTARDTILEAERGSDAQQWAITTLLQRLDNDLTRLERMLVAMLTRRDQWLPVLMGGIGTQGGEDERRLRLEEALTRAIEESLEAVDRLLTPGVRRELLATLPAAASLLQENVNRSAIQHWLDTTTFPTPTVEQVPLWLGLRESLLIRSGTWRKSTGINKNLGFPPPSSVKNTDEKAWLSQHKKRFIALLEKLRENEPLRLALGRVDALPSPAYSDDGWQLLEALSLLLPLAAARLRILFALNGEVDHSEVAMQAVASLGEPDNPTDLSLRLDHQIGHILIDEFQDTSHNQFELLLRLTAGWTGEDGRTLFLVGDPMQSIYRFRMAEVGLFYQARTEGIGAVRPLFRELTVNFRSERVLVEWVNDNLNALFPTSVVVDLGAVPYFPSTAHRPSNEGSGVTLLACPGTEDQTQAEMVISAIREALEIDPDGSIAVLVRARTHLPGIVQALTDGKIPYQGVEITTLANTTIVRDLLALTQVLSNAADRIAWLALLRAPWCGLELKDLLTLSGSQPGTTLWNRMRDGTVLEQLSADGRQRLLRLRRIIGQALGQRRRLPLRDLVEHTWNALGGPTLLTSTDDLEHADAFLTLLSQSERAGNVADMHRLIERTDSLLASSGSDASGQLQLMTIHKAKGLEFDTVILPGLYKTTQADRADLLNWMERTRSDGGSDLILAPLKLKNSADPTLDYIMRMKKAQANNETLRLLYVAATRAKKRLVLVSGIPLSETRTTESGDPLPKPPANAFLGLLWKTQGPRFEAAMESHRLLHDTAHTQENPTAEECMEPPPRQRRLPAEWSPPAMPADAATAPDVMPESSDEEPMVFDWAGETVRRIGVVVHRILQQIGEEGIQQWSADTLEHRHALFAAHLIDQGLDDESLPDALRRVDDAVRASLSDPRGRWIFDPDHGDAQAELPLSGRLDGRRIHGIIDRTFIDTQGIRWIIDFKTSLHSGSDLDAFLDNEKLRYHDQMLRYARLMARFDPEHPIHLGLYFPLLRGWRAWEYENQQEAGAPPSDTGKISNDASPL